MGASLGQSSDHRKQAVLSEINVTPFVDVMLVLLIIFMVTTPLIQQGIEVDLPKTSSSGVSVTEDPFTIVIDASKNITAGKQIIKLAVLREKLKSIFETRKNKQLYLQADKKVDYGVVAEVIAEARAAGIHSIGLITNPKHKENQ